MVFDCMCIHVFVCVLFMVWSKNGIGEKSKTKCVQKFGLNSCSTPFYVCCVLTKCCWMLSIFIWEKRELKSAIIAHLLSNSSRRLKECFLHSNEFSWWVGNSMTCENEIHTHSQFHSYFSPKISKFNSGLVIHGSHTFIHTCARKWSNFCAC